MKKFEEMLDSFECLNEKEEENYKIFNEFILEKNIYLIDYKEFSNKIKINLFVNSLKRKIFIESLKQTIKITKNQWAFNSIELLFKKVFYSKSKFLEAEFKEIENLKNLLKQKISKINHFDSNGKLRDEKIKNNPLESAHQVSDARAERIMSSGIDTWASKQNGLSNGKLLL